MFVALKYCLRSKMKFKGFSIPCPTEGLGFRNLYFVNLNRSFCWTLIFHCSHRAIYLRAHVCYLISNDMGQLKSLQTCHLSHTAPPLCDAHNEMRIIHEIKKHRRMADRRLLAIPASCRRVAAYNPNWGRVFGVSSPSLIETRTHREENLWMEFKNCFWSNP